MTSTVCILERCVPDQPVGQRGVTIVELMVAILISAIGLFALAVPFYAERTSWAIGWRQTEAQRDAQLVLSAMAHAARQSTSYTINGATQTITFTTSPSLGNCNISFQGGPGFNGGQVQEVNGCNGTTFLLIDAVQSSVTAWTLTNVTPKLARVQLSVVNRTRGNETLQTDLFLRN